MAQDKVSTLLTQGTALENADLMYVSKDMLGTGAVYESQSIAQGDIRATFGVSGTSRYITMYDPATIGESLVSTVIYQGSTSNRIGIGTTSPQEALHVNGGIIATNSSGTPISSPSIANGGLTALGSSSANPFIQMYTSSSSDICYIGVQKHSVGTTGMIAFSTAFNSGGWNFMVNTTGTTINTSGDCALMIKSNRQIGVNIGSSGSVSASLHIKGLGATSSTTTFRVDNSSGTQNFTILDNGSVGIGATTNTDIDDAQLYIKTSQAIVQQFQTTNQFQEKYYSSNSSTSVKTLAASEVIGLIDNTNGSEWGYWGVGIINAGNESGDYINGILNQNIAITRQYSTTGSGAINHACVVVADSQWPGNPTGVLTVFGDDTTDTTLPLISVASTSNTSEGFELFVLYADNRLEMDASIKTQQPTANGAHPWKLGKVRSGAVTLDTSNYVEVDINGTTVKLLKAS